ncbi:hypothetical protein PENSPDRAFT_672370 [Peniophora sp. CONT]|nr:hypothetical protein PENSPDRAFT_672370 [Peniophora sp. CONT]
MGTPSETLVNKSELFLVGKEIKFVTKLGTTIVRWNNRQQASPNLASSVGTCGVTVLSDRSGERERVGRVRSGVNDLGVDVDDFLVVWVPDRSGLELLVEFAGAEEDAGDLEPFEVERCRSEVVRRDAEVTDRDVGVGRVLDDTVLDKEVEMWDATISFETESAELGPISEELLFNDVDVRSVAERLVVEEVAEVVGATVCDGCFDVLEDEREEVAGTVDEGRVIGVPGLVLVRAVDRCVLWVEWEAVESGGGLGVRATKRNLVRVARH